MTTYKEIFGKTIKVVDSDPTDAGAEGQIWYNTTTGTFRSVVPLSTWASGGALNTGRNQVVGVGTQTASIAFAGFNGTARVANAEEYHGSSWTEVGDLNTARGALAGAGTQDTAIAFGGSTGPSTIVGITESWNGSSWSEVADLNTSRFNLSGFGTSTAAIAVGGSAPS